MAEERLIQVPTNGGKESKGWAFGLEGDQFIPVVASALFGLILGTIGMLAAGWGLLTVAGWVFLPPGALYTYFAVFRRNKPKHSDVDGFISLVSSRYISKPHKQPEHPYFKEEDEYS